ncbi:hypothetical protein P4T37_03955 [Bacillus mobilis]|nr:hypothetical protein [Bacillus mobilis]
MNLSIQDEFHLFAEELQRYLSPHILEQLVQNSPYQGLFGMQIFR